MEHIRVEVEVELGRTEISAGELLGLRQGDVMVLNKEFTEPLIAKVEGVPKFSGFAGLWKKNKAYKLGGHLEATY